MFQDFPQYSTVGSIVFQDPWLLLALAMGYANTQSDKVTTPMSSILWRNVTTSTATFMIKHRHFIVAWGCISFLTLHFFHSLGGYFIPCPMDFSFLPYIFFIPCPVDFSFLPSIFFIPCPVDVSFFALWIFHSSPPYFSFLPSIFFIPCPVDFSFLPSIFFIPPLHIFRGLYPPP